MAIAVGDRSRAVARSHAESAEHTASGVAPSLRVCESFHPVAARCAHNSAHRAYCLRCCCSTFWRLVDAIRQHGAVIDGAAEADWQSIRDTCGEPIDPRRRRAHQADLIRVQPPCGHFHQQGHEANRQRLTCAVAVWRALSEGAR